MVELRALAEKVLGWRIALHTHKSVMDEARKTFNEDYADTIKNIVATEGELARAEAALRDEALRVYAVTGNKQPGPGVGIREGTHLDYDPKDALTWAKAHNVCLKLDGAAFEKLVGSGGVTDAGFVTTTNVLTATIATDLGKALEVPPVEGGKP